MRGFLKCSKVKKHVRDYDGIWVEVGFDQDAKKAKSLKLSYMETDLGVWVPLVVVERRGCGCGWRVVKLNS